MSGPQQAVDEPFRVSELEALGALASGSVPGPQHVASLTSRGLVADGKVSDDAMAVAAAIAEPLALVEVVVRRGRVVVGGNGWLGRDLAVVAFARTESVDDPECDLLISPSNQFTTLLAQFLELGPRAQTLPDCQAMISRDDLERLTGRDGEMDGSAAASLFNAPGQPELLESLTSHAVVHWRATLRDPHSPEEYTTCEAIDCGRHGVWVVVELPGEGGDVVLIASTPSLVWRLLSSLVAGDDEPDWPELELPESAWVVAG